MSSAPIQQDFFGENWISMGAKANMLKSTTGYAFHAMAEDALVQAEAIKNQQIAKRKAPKKRFVFYDRLLLKILSESPENGKKIFETLFKNVSSTKVLGFLREKTNIYNEISIFSKLPILLFLKMALKDLAFRLSTLPVLFWPFFFTVFSIFALKNNFQYLTYIILAIGFLSVGLSHGALDHLTAKRITNKKQLVYFILEYLFKGILLGLLWFVFPDLALLFFIVYSAWHFGQADFIEWKLKHSGQSFIWGLVVLFSILFFHFGELEYVLGQIPNLKLSQLINKASSVQLFVMQISTVFAGLFLALKNKSKFIFFTLAYILLTSFLPLLTSFGIYFVLQHSLHGWLHLSTGLNKTSSTLWINSLPFSLGGALLIFAFIFSADSKYVGIFFIILSCLSLPHVLSMDSFYRKNK
jgi:Brp/Blh family beta-carotene 15,15'-monooxygenase